MNQENTQRKWNYMNMFLVNCVGLIYYFVSMMQLFNWYPINLHQKMSAFTVHRRELFRN